MCAGLRGWGSRRHSLYHFLDEESVKIVAVEAAGCGISSGMSAASQHSYGKPGILHGSKSLLMQTDDGQV